MLEARSTLSLMLLAAAAVVFAAEEQRVEALRLDMAESAPGGAAAVQQMLGAPRASRLSLKCLHVEDERRCSLMLGNRRPFEYIPGAGGAAWHLDQAREDPQRWHHLSAHADIGLIVRTAGPEFSYSAHWDGRAWKARATSEADELAPMEFAGQVADDLLSGLALADIAGGAGGG